MEHTHISLKQLTPEFIQWDIAYKCKKWHRYFKAKGQAWRQLFDERIDKNIQIVDYLFRDNNFAFTKNLEPVVELIVKDGEQYVRYTFKCEGGNSWQCFEEVNVKF